MSYPVLFHASDKAAFSAERWFISLTRLRLSLAVTAGLLAAAGVSHGRWFDFASAAAFGGALVVEIFLLAAHPETSWYDARAVAESSKSLAWRYAVRAKPFEESATDTARLFADQLDRLVSNAPVMDFVGAGAIRANHEMDHLRAQTLPIRRKAYLDERLHPQQRWYAERSVTSNTAAIRFKMLLVGIEVVGLTFALASAYHRHVLDVATSCSAAIGAIVAWVAVKQYEIVARAYKVANDRLLKAEDDLQYLGTDNEHAWSEAVAAVEDAISQEHKLWRATRITLPYRE